MEYKLKKYNKKAKYSYSLGTYPTIDLLKYRSECVLKILLKREGVGSEGVDTVISLCKQKGIDYEIQDRVIDRLFLKENTYVVGVFEKYDMDLGREKNHLVLVNPSNTGNVGTIIRTMLGFGFYDLSVIKPAVDIFDPMVVRASMGSLFQVNVRYFESYKDYSGCFANRAVYAFMLGGKYELNSVEFKTPCTLIFGNESKGLDSEYSDLGNSVYIEHSSEIDSLNLSVAVGIVLNRFKSAAR